MTTSETRKLPLMVSINGVIDDLHRSLGLADSYFFCECGHSGCKERITLTRAEYASLRADGGLVLVAAHANDSADAATVKNLRGNGGQLQGTQASHASRAAHRNGDPRGR